MLEGETYAMTAGRAHVVPIGALHRIVSDGPLQLDTVFFTLRTFHREQLRVLRAFLGLWPLSWGERAAGRPERTYPLQLSAADAGERDLRDDGGAGARGADWSAAPDRERRAAPARYGVLHTADVPSGAASGAAGVPGAVASVLGGARRRKA